MRLSQDQQNKIIVHVKDFFVECKDQMETYRQDMTEIYETVNNFKRKKSNPKALNDKDKKSEYLVNKAFEIENKIQPKIIGNAPNWIVTFKPSYQIDKNIEESDMADMVRDYLHDLYRKQDIREVLKLVCKWGIRFGNSFAKVDYKYNIERVKVKKEVEDMDEEWNPVSYIEDDINEKVSGEYPCIEYKSWNDIYYDPRYMRLEDFPWIVELANNVRLSSFTKSKKFMNVDKLIDCCMRPEEDNRTYKQRMLSILWIEIDETSFIKPSTLTVKKYYGYYDLTDSKDMKWERLYEFRTVNDAVVVYAKEISQLPFEDFRVFLDTEAYYAKGYLQSIISLQNELNHQKITAQEYINKALYPPMIRSPNSWIDPRQGNPWPWQIIIASGSGQQALENFVQFPYRDLPPWYWQNQNDLERQIQGATFTIDPRATPWQQAITDTATGAKILAFESNEVTGDTRKEFENMMSRLAYKLLQEAYDNMEWNIKVPKKDWTGDRDVNKEAFKNALSKYNIIIEAGSSSYDSVEQRRNDAIAQFNLWQKAAQMGVPVDLKYLFQKVMETFEGVDTTKLFAQPLPQLPTPWAPWLTWSPWTPNLSNQVPNAQPTPVL